MYYSGQPLVNIKTLKVIKLASDTNNVFHWGKTSNNYSHFYDLDGEICSNYKKGLKVVRTKIFSYGEIEDGFAIEGYNLKKVAEKQLEKLMSRELRQFRIYSQAARGIKKRFKKYRQMLQTIFSSTY